MRIMTLGKKVFTIAILTILMVVGYSAVSRSHDSAAQGQAQSSLIQSAKQTQMTQPEWLKQRLKLTVDQQAKLKPILEDEATQMTAVQEDITLDQQHRRERMLQISKLTKPQIQVLLTPGQQKKFDKLHGGPE
jgi:hypothetical protein